MRIQSMDEHNPAQMRFFLKFGFTIGCINRNAHPFQDVLGCVELKYNKRAGKVKGINR